MMDNVSVIVSESSNSNNNNNNEVVIDLGGFDLEEALAMVAGEARVVLAASNSKSYVSKLPEVIKEEEDEDDDDDDVCSVCMEQLVEAGGNKRVPCGHVYHSECITLWLSHCNSCPLCRRHISLLHY